MWSFSGPYFPVFGLNAEIYRVNLPIQSEYWKTRTRKNSACGRLSCTVCRLEDFEDLNWIWIEKLKNNLKREKQKGKHKERKIQRKTMGKRHHNQDYVRDNSTNAVLFT